MVVFRLHYLDYMVVIRLYDGIQIIWWYYNLGQVGYHHMI
jgi:hypothetical protein